MSTRTGYWLTGLIVGIGLAALVDPYWRLGCNNELTILGFWGGLLSMGFFGEIVAEIRGWAKKIAEPPRDVTPADGMVEIAAILGARGEPNPRDPRFGRFVAMEGAPLSQMRAKGGPPPLLGRVVFASLFLGRDGKGWSDEETARAHGSLIRAGEWIEREAMRLNAAVNVEVAGIYFTATDPVSEPEVELAIISGEHDEGFSDADAEVRLVASASRAAAVLGFRDVADLARQVASRLHADAVVWIIQPRSAGRSFVVRERETGMRGVNLAICYAREDDLPGRLHGPPFVDPVTIVHEALHLFGASDKYGASLEIFPKGAVTARDVMRLDVETLSKLRIDVATASEIGWGQSSPNRPH